MQKKCSRCRILKSSAEFFVRKNRLSKTVSKCRACSSYEKRVAYLLNRDKLCAEQKKRYEADPSKSQTRNKIWRDKNKEHRRLYFINREKSNLSYKLACRLRSRLRSAIKHDSKRGSAVTNLGCSIAELKAHLQSQFQSGMSWSNYGDWHIDHKRPLSAFDLTNPEQFVLAVHYTNLQPLWKEDNLKKGSKVHLSLQGKSDGEKTQDAARA